MSSPDPAATSGARHDPPGPLVAADALRGELADSTAGGRPPLLLDVRWTLAGSDPDGYAAGHLPGAVFLDLDADLAGAPGERGRHPLPDPGDLAASLRRLGVGPDRAVVVYDDSGSLPAARAWWVLRWAGHRDVRVLDGGVAAWQRAGGELESGSVEPVPDPAARVVPGGMPVREAADLLPSALGLAPQHERPHGLLLDARAGERFRGEVEPVDPVAGHVPGALSCPAADLLDTRGRFLAPEELGRWLLPLLASCSGTPVASCGSGVTAAQLVLALELVGVRAALYPGSWSEWVADPERPVATGP